MYRVRFPLALFSACADGFIGRHFHHTSKVRSVCAGRRVKDGPKGLLSLTSPVYSERCPQSPVAGRQAFQLWGCVESLSRMTPLEGGQTRVPEDFDFEAKTCKPRGEECECERVRVRVCVLGQEVGPSLSRSEELN